jgi:hypothetical protein
MPLRKQNDPCRPSGTAVVLLGAAALLVGCLGGPRDRAYIEDIRYREARRAFERTGSVELVREALNDAKWPNAMVNEALYRIEKEFGLYDQEPSPARVRPEAELRAEEQADAELRGMALGLDVRAVPGL